MKFWVLTLMSLVTICSGADAMPIEMDSKGRCVIEGKEFPVIGFGTYRLKGQGCFQAVTQAAEVGYRVIDTATFYDNFEGVGKAVNQLGREKFYVISKVWPLSQTAEKIKKDMQETLERLQISYLDAYFVHFPNSQIPIEETLQAINELRLSGKIRHIGMSNVTVNHLKRCLEVGVPISWVQIEMHPHFVDAELLKFCHDHSIAVQAWAPLGRGRLSQDALLKKIGEKYGKTASQVALRWIVQHGCMPLPGSHNSEHIQQNFTIADFSLSDVEMQLIDEKAYTGQRERIKPEWNFGFTDEYDFSYEECWPKGVKIEKFQGSEIAPHVREIVSFVNEIYRAPPYFYNGDDSGYESYLESFPRLKDVIVCLARVKDEVVGIAVGLPMPDRPVYEKTLLEQGYDLKNLYYLGEFGLKPEYRGKGIEMALYQQIEESAQQNGQMDTICCWEIEGFSQESYFPQDDFWEKRGFVRKPELTFSLNWTNIGEQEESAHKAIYWIKNLKP